MRPIGRRSGALPAVERRTVLAILIGWRGAGSFLGARTQRLTAVFTEQSLLRIKSPTPRALLGFPRCSGGFILPGRRPRIRSAVFVLEDAFPNFCVAGPVIGRSADRADNNIIFGRKCLTTDRTFQTDIVRHTRTPFNLFLLYKIFRQTSMFCPISFQQIHKFRMNRKNRALLEKYFLTLSIKYFIINFIAK